MTLSELQQLFNRAFEWSFEKIKLLLAACILILCGICVVFFQALARESSAWVGMSLTFMPLFLCSGLLLSAGVLFIRLYHDEIKQRKLHYSVTLEKSWSDMTMACYIALPAILCYFILWMVVGVFILLKEIPGLGGFLGAILATVPFLLNLAVILLALGCVLLLYFFAPLIAFKGFDRAQIIPLFIKRMRFDAFCNGLFCIVALLPLLICFGVLGSAFYLTKALYVDPQAEALYLAIQSFFLMLPFAILLAPALLFFFNFSAEAHVYMQKRMRKTDTSTQESTS